MQSRAEQRLVENSIKFAIEAFDEYLGGISRGDPKAILSLVSALGHLGRANSNSIRGFDNTIRGIKHYKMHDGHEWPSSMRMWVAFSAPSQFRQQLNQIIDTAAKVSRDINEDPKSTY